MYKTNQQLVVQLAGKHRSIEQQRAQHERYDTAHWEVSGACHQHVCTRPIGLTQSCAVLTHAYCYEDRPTQCTSCVYAVFTFIQLAYQV